MKVQSSDESGDDLKIEQQKDESHKNKSGAVARVRGRPGDVKDAIFHRGLDERRLGSSQHRAAVR
jgi:ribosomal protein L35AE/L33A